MHASIKELLPIFIQHISFFGFMVPTHAIMAKPMRRRTRGLGFSLTEVDCLLDAVEKYLPIGEDDWDKVAMHHRRHDAEYRRNKTTLKRKFASLYLARAPPGGEQFVSLEALRARSLLKRIRKKINKNRESGGAVKRGQVQPDRTARNPPPENIYEGHEEGKEEEDGERNKEQDESPPSAARGIPRTIVVPQERRQDQPVVGAQPATYASPRRCNQNTRKLDDTVATKMMRMMNKIKDLEEQIEEERQQREEDKTEFMMLLALSSMCW